MLRVRLPGDRAQRFGRTQLLLRRQYGQDVQDSEELLESAIHATKISGTIVYSTCTLRRKKMKVVMEMLRRFPDQIEVVDPREEGWRLGLGYDAGD